MEHFPSGSEGSPNIDIESEYVDFVPREFLDDPVGYFEREGRNIKSGEQKVDETGRVREDPTAVKDLPDWANSEGKILKTVSRRVDTSKGQVGESQDPFYEYEILEHIKKLGLPAASPIAKVEQSGTHLIVMERLPGVRWSERDSLQLRESGYSDEDIANLTAEAEQKMVELKTQFEQAGIVRGWKLKDMVFQLDIENKKVISLTPTDWERTRIIES
jgi:hypothetical protein